MANNNNYSPRTIDTRSRTATLAAALLSAALLTACGGSSSDTQEPDPVAVDLPIAYVKRSLPIDDDGEALEENIRDPLAFMAGAELYIRDRASSEAPETLITAGIFEDDALYDIKDLSVSYDGATLLFAMRAPEDDTLDEDEQASWNIWEYSLEDESLRRIIASDTSAEVGEDIAPAYLSDGRIVFSSTRQIRAKAILLDENKPQYEAQDEDLDGPAFSLHLMDADGTDIRQISFNQSHDLFPTPLSDGRILYLRWDAAGGNDNLSFYTLYPDGSEDYFAYGFHSQNIGTNNTEVSNWSPIQQPDGRILAIQKAPESESYGGDIIAVDIDNYSEIDQEKADSSSDIDSGQVPLSLLDVSTDGSPSPHGLFTSAYPLFDGTERYLVSWSQCRLQDAAMTEILPCTEENLADQETVQSEPLYGLWMYDIGEDSQQPIIVSEQGIMYSEAVVMESRPSPTFVADLVAETELEDQQLGLLNIRSVYDFDGVDSSSAGIDVLSDPLQTSVDERPARFLRIEKAVSMPSEDVYDFNRAAFGAGGRRQLMREIVGYVQIEPDGSVLTLVPANVALAISVLDAEGKRISQRHENWLHPQVGGQIQCNGCHTGNSQIAHGRPDAEPDSINPGASTSGLPFANSNPAIIAEIEETMAEAYGRTIGIRTPSVDLIFSDDWVDAGSQTAADSFAWAYADLETAAPTSESCQSEWNSLCRTVIHYPTHIQPIFDLERPIFDVLSVEIDNHRCTLCHSNADIDGLDQVPAAQLDLRANQSVDNVNYATSYQELFVQNNEQVLDDMANLIFLLVESGNFEVDIDGELILDEFGDPIPILVQVSVTPIMRTTGAIASSAFFEPFATGGSHQNYLSDIELKLIAEWLDIGAQYYNNPFDAPAD